MNTQHVVLYQKNVLNPQYIPTLLKNDKEIKLYVVKDISGITERMAFYQLHCILYECDLFTKENLQDINEIEKLNILYYVIANEISKDVYIDKKQVIFKSKDFIVSKALSGQLIVKIKSLYFSDKDKEKTEGFVSTHIIGIGASTGGPHAIVEILKTLPTTIAGIVIVQHMSEMNTASFVAYLNTVCDLKVKVAQNYDVVKNGVVYIAKQKQHLVVQRKKDGYHLRYIDGEKVNCVCPSIDVLFHSMASELGVLGVGILLTGMGSDGAIGLKRMNDAGALTIIQDEETSDLYSMPKEAKKIGAYQKELPLQKMSEYLVKYFNIKEKRKIE